MKRSELRRSTKPLKRSAIKRRKRIPADERAWRDAVRDEVIRRDRVCVLNPQTANRSYIVKLTEPHRCFGVSETMHHLKKASAGGEYSVDNLVLMCAYGNDWVEDHPAEAHRLGLVKRRGDAEDS